MIHYTHTLVPYQYLTKTLAYIHHFLLQIHCRGHEAANEARKLTPKARREKTMRKLNEDTSLGVHVSLYQVKDLHHPQKQYKVDVNARQLYMTGNAGGVKNKVYKFLPI